MLAITRPRFFFFSFNEKFHGPPLMAEIHYISSRYVFFFFSSNSTHREPQKTRRSWWNMAADTPVSLLPCVSAPGSHVPTRSIDTDQDTLETKATSEPHQRAAPIKSWWQRENRESEPRLMCVATDTQREGEARDQPRIHCLCHKHTARCERMTHAGIHEAKADKLSALICLTHRFPHSVAPL